MLRTSCARGSRFAPRPWARAFALRGRSTRAAIPVLPAGARGPAPAFATRHCARRCCCVVVPTPRRPGTPPTAAAAAGVGSVSPGLKAAELTKNFEHLDVEERLYAWCAPSAALPWSYQAVALERRTGCQPAGSSPPPPRRSAHRWESAGYFAPREDGEPFVISMPPPNVTGALHMGHAMFVTLQARRAAVPTSPVLPAGAERAPDRPRVRSRRARPADRRTS